jgi:hypothetical protein
VPEDTRVAIDMRIVIDLRGPEDQRIVTDTRAGAHLRGVRNPPTAIRMAMGRHWPISKIEKLVIHLVIHTVT